MICKKCQKEIDDDSKFCEFCQNKTHKDYSYVIKQMEKSVQVSEKRKKLKTVFKNTILIISVFITIAFLLEATVNDLDGIGLFFAIPMTLLVIFVYNKVAKKFGL